MIEMTLTLSYWSFSVRSASVWLYAKMTVFDSVDPPPVDVNLKWHRYPFIGQFLSIMSMMSASTLPVG